MRPLSYSQISQYINCPLSYKLRYIDGLQPKAKWYFSFGSTLHQCAERFYKVQVPPPPTLEKLLIFYEDNWVSQGYESAEQEDSYRQYGREILSEFWRINSQNYRIPIAVEYNFKLDIGGVKLGGFIDRVDKLETGGLSIIDYKSNKEIFTKEDLQKNLQLTLYQLAADQLWLFPVEKLCLYHLRTNSLCSCEARNKKQLDDARRIVLDVAENIERAVFPARENSFCPCDFPEHCPYYRQKYITEGTQEKEEEKAGINIPETVERYVSTQNSINELKTRLEEIREIITNYCQDNNLNRVFGKEYAITCKLVEKTDFSEDEVRTLLEPEGLWQQVLSFDKSKLMELAGNEKVAEEIKVKLDKLKKVISISPRLWVRRITQEE